MKKKLAILAFIIGGIVVTHAYVAPMFVYKTEQQDNCQRWVEHTLQKMTLRQRVAQLFVYTVDPLINQPNINKIQKVVREDEVGGLLFSGGLAHNEARLTNMAQNESHIPLMITFDGEWGLSMRLKNLPLFPKNEVLGCIQDDRLLYYYGREMARECHLMGVQVNFAPVADINRNPNNPVINVRSFGEEPMNVANKVISYSQGLENNGILSVAKHFPGHGDTNVDSHKALPVLNFTRERLDSVELFPFKHYIRAGLSGIMVGHLEVPALENANSLFPSSLSKNIVYDLLSDELHFNGLIFTDALAMKGVSSASHVCLRALQAGNDILLAPANLTEEINDVILGVQNGEITLDEINEKCRKVLIYKYAMGLYKRPHIDIANIYSNINNANAARLASQLRLAAVTVLGNRDATLPLPPYTSDTLTVLNIGIHAADSAFVRRLRSYSQVRHLEITDQSTQLAIVYVTQTMARSSRAVVCITTNDLNPYLDFISSLSFTMPTIYVSFSTDKTLNSALIPLSMASAVIMGHSADRDVQMRVAKVMFARAPANGRISTSIGTLYNPGDGVDIYPGIVETNAPEQAGMNPLKLNKIDSIARSGVYHKAYPGCQVLVMRKGKVVYERNFGTFAYNSRQTVKPNTMYDLASLSKTTGTLLGVMKLCDQGLLSINDKVSDYLPFMCTSDKKNITIKQLLMHESGMPAYLPFYKLAIDDNSYTKPFFTTKKDKNHVVKAGANIWSPTHFFYKKGITANKPSAAYPIHVYDDLYLRADFHTMAMNHIAQAKLGPKKYLYSCLNFILLREVIEKISGKPLDEFLQAEFFRPMHLEHIAYLPLQHKHTINEISPTAYNHFLRPGILQGYVNDEDAAYLGGVSGNAGLFANAHDVALIYQMMINGGSLEGHQYISKHTIHLFTTNTSKISYRGLGFDRPNKRNPPNSPCCASAPATVFGHTGFTGTCAWADPTNKLVYVFLSNRTYPNSWNNKLSTLGIRRNIQQAIYSSLKK
jgi:beta-glucosidase-like glycosyl hydrolase/CubicO group peptidase (beta-lactamase class C family)